MAPTTGRFTHLTVTPHQHESKPFEGELEAWDTNEYIDNMTLEAYYPLVVEPYHTWQNIVDFGDRRYLYQYVRREKKIFDITDPREVTTVRAKGSLWESGDRHRKSTVDRDRDGRPSR